MLARKNTLLDCPLSRRVSANRADESGDLYVIDWVDINRPVAESGDRFAGVAAPRTTWRLLTPESRESSDANVRAILPGCVIVMANHGPSGGPLAAHVQSLPRTLNRSKVVCR